MTSSSSIWQTLEREPVLTGVEAQWRQWLDTGQELEAIRAFLRPEQTLATAFPCPTTCASGCLRRIVEHDPDDFVAVCDDPGSGSEYEPLRVARSELVLWRFDRPSFARAVAKVLGLSGNAGGAVPHATGALVLGSLVKGDGPTRAAYLAVPNEDGLVPKLVAGASGPIVVVVTDRGSLGPHDAMLLASNGGEAFFSVEALAWVGRIGLIDATKRPTRRPTAVVQLITADGRSTVPRADITMSEEDLDLVVDLTTTTGAGRYKAGRRTQKGAFEETSLSWAQAAALAELIESGQALRPAELQSLTSISEPTKIVEQARRAVDVKLSRYAWRSIHTLRAEGPSAKRFQFTPPGGLSYAVLLPGIDK